LRDLSERLSLIGASRESVRIWVHRLLGCDLKFELIFIPVK
jgi:hypothetical protein